MTASSTIAVGNGRYRLQARIGGGQFGEVYRADDLDEGGEVAVKLFIPSVKLSDAILEAQLQRRLSQHPRVVALRNLDVRTSAGPIVVTELRPAGSVAGAIGTGRATLGNALQWTRDAVDALAHAHANNVLHRDAKASNLLLDAAGRASLCDFGVSEDTITGAGGLLTYPDLVAPELGTSGSSVQTEIFMVGVLMYRLLCGAYPFPQGAKALPATTIVRPQDARVDIPQAWIRVIQTALAIDPGDRLQSMNELRDALLRIRIVTEFVADAGGTRWVAPLPDGRQVDVEIAVATRGRFQAVLRVDRGAGPRTAKRSNPRSSAAQARRDAITLMRGVVAGDLP